MNPKVSVIMPTYGRQHLFPLIYDCFAKQAYQNAELLILDDSAEPSRFFEGRPGARYFYSTDRMSIGAKRNFLIDKAEGEIIAHFDDDDFYAPNYLLTMVEQLKSCDMVHLTGWFVYAVSQKAFGYWQTDKQTGIQFVFQSGKPVGVIKGTKSTDSFVRGYGFSYAYKKDLWRRCHFPDRSHGEDYAWVLTFDKSTRVKSVIDDQGLVLHIIHASNTSRCFPQYIIPARLLFRLFGPDIGPYVET